MAKSEIILPNGDKVTGNWSTEETMAGILKILETKYGKTGAGGAAKKEETAQVKQSKLYAKIQEKGAKVAKKAQALGQKVNEKTKEQLEKFPKVNKALDVLADGSGLAGRGLKNLGSTAADLHDDLDNLGGSAHNTSNAFFGLVGGAGALGTAFGFVAGLIDQYAEFQVAALQTGYGFSSELTNTRVAVGALGMNMAQYSRILVENGESVRILGRTGLESSNEFIKLIDNVKTTAYQFGMFGMTTEEMSSAVGKRLRVAMLQGLQGQDAALAVTNSFNELNHQVLAYAQLTGRERREIMRNNIEEQEGQELLLHNLSKMGNTAVDGYNAMKQGVSAIFGSRGGGALSELFDAEFNQFFLGGMEQMSTEQLAALDISGIRGAFEETQQQIAANINDPEAVRKITIAGAEKMGKILSANQDKIARMAGQLGADDPLSIILTSLLSASQEQANFMARSIDERTKAFGPDTLEANERNLALVRDRIDVLQNELMGALLQGMGIGGIEDIANDETFAMVKSGISTFGDGLNQLREGVLAVSDFFGGGTTGLIATMTAGAVALFATSGLLTKAMVAGATTMWSSAGVVAGAGGASKGLGFLSKLAPLAKKIPYIGTAITAGAGVMDQDYKDAGYSWMDRAGLGVGEGAIDLADMGWNALTGAAGLVGVGPGWNNDTDMSQAFKNWATDPAIAAAMQPYNKAALTPTPEYIPNVPDKLTGIVQGASFGANGDVNTGMDSSNAWRFTNSDNELLRRMALALEESNRINKKLLDATENQ